MIVSTALVQLAGHAGSAEASRQRIVAHVEAAARAGARLVVFPELAVSGYTLDTARLNAAAEPLEGPTLESWSQLAAELDVHIAGGFCERADGRLYNTAVLVGPDGLILHYRKLHLFDREKLVFAPGDKGLPVAATPLGSIGLCVCYDLRFVEVVRALALKGADIVTVPTAWVGGFDPNPRDAMGLIGQARGAAVQANLSQVYLACASFAGRDGDVEFLGSSLVADPYGSIVAGPLDAQEEQCLMADLDLDAARASQARTERIMPRADRRRDVYGIAVDGGVL